MAANRSAVGTSLTSIKPRDSGRLFARRDVDRWLFGGSGRWFRRRACRGRLVDRHRRIGGFLSLGRQQRLNLSHARVVDSGFAQQPEVVSALIREGRRAYVFVSVLLVDLG